MGADRRAGAPVRLFPAAALVDARGAQGPDALWSAYRRRAHDDDLLLYRDQPDDGDGAGARRRHSAAALSIGRASCRERVCQYVSISVVPLSFKKKNQYSTSFQTSP